jgi:sugar lactone lactonase YvrE
MASRRLFDGAQVELGILPIVGAAAPPSGITGTASGTISFTGAATGTVVTPGAWEVAGASYGGVSFSVAGQDSQPNGVAFSADGTKMYITGFSNQRLYQYSLSTAWDASTASYSGTSFSVAAQEPFPLDLAFSADGTKMYVIGRVVGEVHQYSLSTAWDIGSASYGGISFNVSGQEGNPNALAFSADGTRMYVLGISTDAVYQYSLSTAWDVSSASYGGVSFSVAGQEGLPFALAFKPDGSRMYVVGGANDTVYQYSLSTAWHVSSAAYGGFSFSVAAQETEPTGLAFKPDGSRMYIVGNTTDTVYQYDLGATTINGTASGTLPLTGAATGAVVVSGTTAGTLPLSGTTAGKVNVSGLASGSIPLLGSATGTITTLGAVNGSAAGTISLVGTASAVVLVSGTVGGTLPLDGSATGRVAVSGVASGTIPLGGSGVTSVLIRGSSAGSLSLAGSATGVVGSVGISGTAAGTLGLSGSSAGIVSEITLGDIPISEAIEIIFNSEILPGLTLREAVLEARKTSKLALALSL